MSIVLVVSRLLGLHFVHFQGQKEEGLGCGLLSSDSLGSSAPCVRDGAEQGHMIS